MNFIAADVECFDENDAYVVSLSDGRGESGEFLMLEKSSKLSPGDAELGLDGVYLQSATFSDYGEIDAVELTPPILTVRLSQHTAKQFDADSSIRIEVGPNTDWVKLEKFLRLIVGNARVLRRST